MTMPRVNLVVIGHKDHGKSTLIGRLLFDSKAIKEQKLNEIQTELKRSGKKFEFAFLLDSLEEERKGGLTIDIMHTPFKSNKFLYTIIDCPGHKEFIEKMLTGVSEADAAVLVTSAKEGIQDQTRQHAFLIKTLGIEQLVVAINKLDSVNYSEDQYKKTCKELGLVLQNLGYQNVPMIPISAIKGDNIFKKSEKMKWYTGPTLIETLDEKVVPNILPVNKPLRGVVQDIYPYENNQRLVVCKIESGTLIPEKSVVFNPSGKKTVLKEIMEFGSTVSKAQPGDSIGLLLEDSRGLERGEILSYPENQPKIVNDFVVEVILFTGIQIKNDDVLTIHCGTAQTKCKVNDILTEIDPVNLDLLTKNPTKLDSESVGELELSALEPLSLELYSDFPELGRFVIEGKKGTVGAGIVLKILS